MGAPAAKTGEDEEWEEFLKKLKEKAEKRKAAISSGQALPTGDVEEVHAEEPESGIRKPIKMASPKLPSELEIEEHELSHVPYRSWCRHCVRGRGKELPHMAAGSGAGGAHEIHMDLCFPGEEDGSGGLTVLVAQDRESRMKMASAMPSKSTGTFIARRIVAFMREVGCEQGDITVKTDQEEAMKSIVTAVGRVRAAAGGGRMTVEMSPVGQSQSNGIAERAIQSVEGQTRVLKDALEGRLKMRIPAQHPMMPWLVEWAAVVLNRYEVGKDGKTSFERCKGKQAKTFGLEFGEAVLWKRKPSGGHLGKLTCLWEDGVFLGIKGCTGEIIVANGKGVWRTRTVHRKPAKDRWCKEGIETVKGVPWRTSDDDKKADGEDWGEKMMVPNLEGEQMEGGELEATKEFLKLGIPRQFRTKDADYQVHGYTRGCVGCKSLLGGTTKQKHSDQCRARMAEAMVGNKRVEDAKERKRKYIEEALRAEEQKQDEKKEKDNGENKRKRLEEIEAQAMQTDDVEELGKLFTEYMEEEFHMTGKKRTRDDEDETGGATSSTDVPMDSLELNQEDEYEADQWALDDITGQWLDAEKVTAARKEEVQYMGKLSMFEPSIWEECIAKTGKPPITTKWIDVNKGSAEEPIVRSRLVARDFRLKGEAARFDLFAAMPPLEAKRMLFLMAVRRNRERPKKKYKLLFIDVKKAHLNGKVLEDEWAYVVLPAEAGGGVARLRRWLYGMRPAARAWEEDYAAKLVGAGFRRGVSAPTVFWHPLTDVSIVVHGDDFTALGPEKELRALESLMKSWYEIKTRGMLGPDPKDDKEIKILNRKVVWGDRVITYEADARNVESILKSMGLDANSKGLDAPIVVETTREAAIEEVELGPAEAKKFRSVAALANYVAMDRPDIQVAVSMLCQKMSKPTQKSWEKLKRVARYLKKYPVLRFEYREETGEKELVLRVYADSDWAGCKETRKSRSGGFALLGGGLVKSWSNRQATPALSSGEAEYYAVVKAAAEALGMEALAKDLGWEVKVRLMVDSTAAKAIASRSGLGKVRHLEVRHLWVQDAVSRGRFVIKKVMGKFNPADVLTKPLSQAFVQKLLEPFGVVFVSPLELGLGARGGVGNSTP